MSVTVPKTGHKASSISFIERISSSIAIKPLAAAVLVFLLAVYLQNSHISISVGFFLALHLLSEISSIVVCFAVFATAFYGFQQTRNQSDMVLGLALAVVGCFDFVHALSYKGMPDPLGDNSVGLAAAYWLVARLIFGIGIIAACLINSKSYDSLRRVSRSFWLGLVFVAAVVALFTTHNTLISNALYNENTQSLTTLKVVLEFICIFLYLVGIFLIDRKKGWNTDTTRVMRTALIIAIAAELFFSWYRSPYDWYNASGHILKSIAYLCILNAIFAYSLQKPYLELKKAQKRLTDLYKETRQSRIELENSFSRIGTALSASVRVSEAALIVAQLAREISRSDCAVISVNERSQISAQQACSGSLGPCPGLTRIAEEYGSRALIENRTISEAFNTNPMRTVCMKGDEHPIRHMLSLPLIHEGKLLGLVSLFRRSDDPYKPRDINLVNAFSQHAGVAIHNAISFEREQHIASILQEYITHVPPVVGEKYDIGYMYKPVLDEASVGGDFLDVIRLPENKLGLAIGDVAGKGLKAAVHTAMLKYAIRAFLSEGHSPGEATKRLDILVPDFVEDDRFITLFIAVLDIDTGELLYTNAGHEPPIFCKHNICGSLIPTGPVLGIGMSEDFGEARVRMEKDDALVMFTDGLIERGAGMPDFSIETVAHILMNSNKGNCNSLVESIYQASRSSESGEMRDDVAVLGIRAL